MGKGESADLATPPCAEAAISLFHVRDVISPTPTHFPSLDFSTRLDYASVPTIGRRCRCRFDVASLGRGGADGACRTRIGAREYFSLRTRTIVGVVRWENAQAPIGGTVDPPHVRLVRCSVSVMRRAE